MKVLFSTTLFTSLLLGAAAQSADAPVATDVQRNVNQQQRIEQGLQSGELTTKEGSKLEREQTSVDRIEKRDLRNGDVSTNEQGRLTAAQNRVSRDVYAEKHDAAVGNPSSTSSQRMQANVQRNINQQQRIEQGARSGQLTNHEVGTLERGQARVNRREASAAANGRVGTVEQAGIEHRENIQSRRIMHKKHNSLSS